MEVKDTGNKTVYFNMEWAKDYEKGYVPYNFTIEPKNRKPRGTEEQFVFPTEDGQKVRMTITHSGPQTWKINGPERAASFSFIVYSLTWIWFIQTKKYKKTCWLSLPWYRSKSTPSFQDALAGLRSVLWHSRILNNSAKTPLFTKNIDPHLANDSDLEVRLDRDQIQAHYPNGAPAAWPPYCDLGPCNEIWYMRINHPDWQKLFFRYFDSMVGDYGLEAVFLDQISNIADDPACDFVAATVDLLKRIHSRFPGLLIGCEIVNEFVVSHIPLIQSSWLEDSMPKEAFSPLIRLLYPPDRVRFFPHFFLAAAVPCRYTAMNLPWLAEHGMHAAFALYQEFNRRMGGIPTVRLDYGRFGVDAESLKVLQTAEGAGCNKTI